MRYGSWKWGGASTKLPASFPRITRRYSLDHQWSTDSHPLVQQNGLLPVHDFSGHRISFTVNLAHTKVAKSPAHFYLATEQIQKRQWYAGSPPESYQCALAFIMSFTNLKACCNEKPVTHSFGFTTQAFFISWVSCTLECFPSLHNF